MSSNYPNGFAAGVTIRGVPLLSTNPGEVFWVNGSGVLAKGGVGGSNGNDGSYRRPFATIDYAVGRCTANRGDIIVVMPGHSEDISAASSLDLDVAGVAVIGLGAGSLRPDLNFSATAGTVDIAAADVTLYNLTFTADVSAVVVGVNVDANGATIDNCEFKINATGDDFIMGVNADGFDDFTFSNNKYRAENNVAGAAQAIRLDESEFVTITGNTIIGEFSAACILGEGAVSTLGNISDNYLFNQDTTGGETIDLNVASTGIIFNNSLATLFTTAPETSFDPGSMLCNQNYCVNSIDESGTIVPPTIST